MPKKKYIVSLSESERQQLENLTKFGKTAAYKMNYARILLLSDINSPDGSWKDPTIKTILGVSVPTIERVRKRFVEEGLAAALSRKKPVQQRIPILDGEKEAHLIALVCSEPPDGQARWSLRLLADKMIALGYVETVSYETVRQTLKKRMRRLGGFLRV